MICVELTHALDRAIDEVEAEIKIKDDSNDDNLEEKLNEYQVTYPVLYSELSSWPVEKLPKQEAKILSEKHSISVPTVRKIWSKVCESKKGEVNQLSIEDQILFLYSNGYKQKYISMLLKITLSIVKEICSEGD